MQWQGLSQQMPSLYPLPKCPQGCKMTELTFSLSSHFDCVIKSAPSAFHCQSITTYTIFLGLLTWLLVVSCLSQMPNFISSSVNLPSFVVSCKLYPPVYHESLTCTVYWRCTTASQNDAHPDGNGSGIEMDVFLVLLQP